MTNALDFDTVLMNGYQAMPGFLMVFGYKDPSLAAGYGIDTQFQQLITSLLNVGLIVSALSIGMLSRYFGRRPLYWFGSALSIAGLLLQILCTVKGAVYAGRLLLGLGNGLFVNSTILYIAETSPAHLRGILIAMYQFTQNLGGLMGAIVNNYCAKMTSRLAYQIPSSILLIIPVFLLLFAFWIPESPRWLCQQGRSEEALRCLERLRAGTLSNEHLHEELLEIKEAIEIEKELTSGITIRDLVRGSDLRRTLLTIGAATSHQGSGIYFLVAYGTYFLQVSNIPNPFEYSIGIQVMSVVGSILGMFLQRYLGRRPIFISGNACVTVTLFTVAIIWTAAGNVHTIQQGKAIVAMIMLMNFAYSYSVGPTGWLVAGELPSNRLRSMTFGIAMAVGFFCAWLTSFTTPYFFNPQHLGWGPKIGWIWGPVSLILLIWAVFFLPETKGRTLEECIVLFMMIELINSGRDVCAKVAGLEVQRVPVCGNRERSRNSGKAPRQRIRPFKGRNTSCRTFGSLGNSVNLEPGVNVCIMYREIAGIKRFI